MAGEVDEAYQLDNADAGFAHKQCIGNISTMTHEEVGVMTCVHRFTSQMTSQQISGQFKFLTSDVQSSFEPACYNAISNSVSLHILAWQLCHQ